MGHRERPGPDVRALRLLLRLASFLNRCHRTGCYPDADPSDGDQLALLHRRLPEQLPRLQVRTPRGPRQQVPQSRTAWPLAALQQQVPQWAPVLRQRVPQQVWALPSWLALQAPGRPLRLLPERQA